MLKRKDAREGGFMGSRKSNKLPGHQDGTREILRPNHTFFPWDGEVVLPTFREGMEETLLYFITLFIL